MKKKNPIKKVKFEYVGTEVEFQKFLESLVHSYFLSGCFDTKTEGGFVDKVEKKV